jgi:serine protease Do
VAYLAALMILSAAIAPAWQSLESGLRTTGDETMKAFEPVRAVLQSSSAVIYDGRDEVAYGVVISADGLILTKASEIAGKEKLGATVDTTRYECQVLAVDEKWDVALIKIPADGLTPVRYAPGANLTQGSWVVANGATSRLQRRALAGIVSAKTREIPPEGGGVLGIALKPGLKEAVVDQVPEKSGAAEAGIQPGDVIVAIRGKKIGGPMDLAELVKTLKVGEMVPVTYRRKGAEKTVDVRVSERAVLFKGPASRNDQMSGRVSSRRGAFPRAFQHDILGASDSMGGPVLNLDGKCVGMNIARADRAETYAIPSEDVQEIAKRLLAKKEN